MFNIQRPFVGLFVSVSTGAIKTTIVISFSFFYIIGSTNGRSLGQDYLFDQPMAD